MDNIAALYESIDEAKRKKKRLAIFIVNFAKAYYSVSWDFINKYDDVHEFQR